MSENINDLCGNINGRPIAGYHVVRYGETQEYLESLAKEGYMMVYLEDNPPEEGKLTVAKPNTMPEWLRDYATNVVYDEYGNFISCSVEGLITLAENQTEEEIAEVNKNTYYYSPGSAIGPAVLVSEEAKTTDTTVTQDQTGISSINWNDYFFDTTSEPELILDTTTDLFYTNHLYAPPVIAYLRSHYQDEIAPKMNGIDSLTDEEAASFYEDLNSFREFLSHARADIAHFLKDTSSYEDLDVMQDTIDSYIAALDEKETKTTDITIDPGSLDGPNPIGGGHHRYHFVQYGETQEYLESLAKEGYMMVYLEDNPPEEGKLTISKPNPEPDPITITAVSEPINIQELVLSVDLTEEEIAAVLHSYREIAQLVPSDIPYQRIILKSTADTARDYGEGWSAIGRGDFNGNGTKDVLVANPTAASDTVGLIGYWENDSEWNLIGGYSPEWDVLATADFNGDGKTDILWRNSFVGEDGNTYNAYCTWIMDEDDGWRMVSASNADEWDFLCTGDFNGDGTADIAMINASGLVSVWGVSDGRLDTDAVLSAVDTSEWKFATVGDFNGDGTDDIMWAHTDGAVYADRYGYWQIDDGQLASWESGSAGLIFISERLQPIYATLA